MFSSYAQTHRLRRGFLLCSFLMIQGAAIDGIRALTLEEALQRAEEDSPFALEIVRDIEHARAEVRAAGLWPNPELSYSQEESGNETEQVTEVSLEIPLGGRLALERKAAHSLLRGAEALGRQTRVELWARVREAFLELLRFQERMRALEAGMVRFDELVEVLRAREREGESSGFDRMRAERERATVEVELLESRQSLAAARSALAALVGLPAETLRAEGHLPSAGTLPGREEILTAAMSRGDLAALDAQAERADYLARAARRRLIPEPTVSAGTKSTDLGGVESSGPTFGITLALPVFNRGQGERAVALAEGALLRARRDSLRRSIEAEVDATYTEAMTRREAEDAYARAPDPSELARIAWAAYEEGEMGILELLDAHRLALEVRLRSIDLSAAARGAEVALDRVAGMEVAP